MPTTFIPFADCCEAVIQFLLDGVPGLISLGFHHTVAAAYSVTNLADLATAIHTGLIVPLKARQTGQVKYTNIHLRDLDTVTGAVFDQPLTDVGTATGDNLPNQVAMTVTFLTGVAGRSYRGRNYVPALPAASTLTDRTWDPAVIAAVQAAYETFDLALPAADSEHVVLSRANGGAPRMAGVATRVIGYRANTQIFTQRRRLT